MFPVVQCAGLHASFACVPNSTKSVKRETRCRHQCSFSVAEHFLAWLILERLDPSWKLLPNVGVVTYDKVCASLAMAA